MQRRCLQLSCVFSGLTILPLGACGEDSEPAGPDTRDAAIVAPGLDASPDDGGLPATDAAPFVCDVVAPTTCIEPAPTYASVEPIIMERCVSCHDGQGEQWALNRYDHVADWYDSIRAMMLDCSMPPRDSGLSMPTTEREHILAWIRCGYPE